MAIDPRQTKEEGYYGAYGRKKAEAAARAGGGSWDYSGDVAKKIYNQSTYTTDGGTRVYDTATGKLVNKQESSSYVPLDKYTNSAGISGSSMVRDDISKTNAVNNATKEMNDNLGGYDTGTTTPSSMSSVDSMFMDIFRQENKETSGLIDKWTSDLLASNDRIYDIQLAREDNSYKWLMDDIKRKNERAVQVATSNAISLNPYSQARGAQTAENFNTAINAEYSRVAQEATDKYRLAREALAAGRSKDAMMLKQSAQQSLLQAEQNLTTNLQNIYKDTQEQQRWEVQQESKYQDDLIESISSMDLTNLDNLDPSSMKRITELAGNLGMDSNELNAMIKFAATEQGIKIEDAKLDKAYKIASINNLNRNDSGGGTDRFTQSQINSGVARSGLATPAFLKLPEDIQNFYIEMSPTESQTLSSYLKEVQEGQVTPDDVKEIIDYDFADASEEVKNYLYEAVDSYIPKEGEVGDTDSKWGDVWNSIQSLFK